MFARTLHPRYLTFVALATVVISFAAVAVPFTHRSFPGGHDATAHITYTYLFDRALSQGQFPVRWIEWVRSGDSQPLFNFYYPGLYYLIAFVHAFGPPLSLALKATIAASWWAGSLFMYAFLKPSGLLPAALGAALFALSPYVILDAFVRAAYAEFAAIALAPGLLWSCDRVLRVGRVGPALAAAAITGLMLITHLPSVLIFGPVFAAYVAYLLVTSQTTLRRIGMLMLSVMLGLALAAFYVVPALAELHLVAMSKMTSGYFDYRRHFVAPAQWIEPAWGYGASVEGHGDDLSFQIGIAQCLAIAGALGCLLVALMRHRITRSVGDLAFWLSVVAFAMFAMTEAADGLWRVVTPLAYLQFPWRFLMVIAVASSVLAARLLSLVRQPVVQALIVIAAVGLQYGLYHDYLAPAGYIPRAAMNIDDPRWAESDQAGTHAFIDRGFTPLVAQQEAARGIGRWSGEGAGNVVEVSMADHRMVLDVESADGMQVRLNSHYFPGWRVWVDGTETAIAVDPTYGFMDVQIAPGAHRLEASFTNARLRTYANALSGVSIAACLLMIGRRRNRRSLEARRTRGSPKTLLA